MSKDEIVTALRICASGVDCAKGNCAFLEPNGAFGECTKKKNNAAADLIENQQNHIAALMQANAALRDTVQQRDAQITDMSEGLAQFSKAVAVKSEPTADVATVVYCRECEHSYEAVGGRFCTYGVCVDCEVPDDFYCGNGKRG